MASTAPPAANTTGLTLSPSSTVASVTPAPLQLPSSEATVVGENSPPILRKIAEKIWKLEYVVLSELLPSCLGHQSLPCWTCSHSGTGPKRLRKFRLSSSGLPALKHPSLCSGDPVPRLGEGHASILLPDC